MAFWRYVETAAAMVIGGGIGAGGMVLAIGAFMPPGEPPVLTWPAILFMGICAAIGSGVVVWITTRGEFGGD